MEGVNRDDFRELDRDVSKIGQDVSALKVEVRNINTNLTELVSKAEFMPVKLIAYGLAAGSMGAVLTAIVSSVVGK